MINSPFCHKYELSSLKAHNVSKFFCLATTILKQAFLWYILWISTIEINHKFYSFIIVVAKGKKISNTESPGHCILPRWPLLGNRKTAHLLYGAQWHIIHYSMLIFGEDKNCTLVLKTFHSDPNVNFLRDNAIHHKTGITK